MTHSKSTIILTGSLILASLFLFFLSETSPLKSFRQAVTRLEAPLAFSMYRSGLAIRKEASFWLKLRQTGSENLTLKERVVSLEGEVARLSEIEQENAILRKQLMLNEKSDFRGRLVLADVIGGEVGGEGSLLINQGKQAGIKKDDVLLVENYLLGKVKEVKANSAIVTLIVDPSMVISALDQSSPTRPRGVVKGRFGTNLVMESILAEESVNVGDIVITSGLDSTFPSGLIIGEVVKVTGANQGSLKSAEIKPILDFTKLEKVFVLRK